MPFNFNDTPTLGETATAPSGAIYLWDGVKWTVTGDQGAVSGGGDGVSSFNTRAGDVVLSLGDVVGAGGAPSVSPSFSGLPLAPTAPPGTATTQIATTAFVAAAGDFDGGNF